MLKIDFITIFSLSQSAWGPHPSPLPLLLGLVQIPVHMGVGELADAPQDQGDPQPLERYRWVTTNNHSFPVWVARTPPSLASSLPLGANPSVQRRERHKVKAGILHGFSNLFIFCLYFSYTSAPDISDALRIDGGVNVGTHCTTSSQLHLFD